jgi:subtilisin family serine protease
MATQKKQTARPSRSAKAKKPTVPKLIYAQASPRSVGGVSLFEAQTQIRPNTVTSFMSEAGMINAAAAQLQQAGFEILQVTALTINIAGPAELYEQAFNTTIIAEERPVIKPIEGETTATFLDSPDATLPGLITTRGTTFENVLEGVALEEPRYFFAASMFAPLKSYWHLRLPGDVSLGCNADRAHRSLITGKNVRVAMVDSGWFRHPYFVGRGYRAAPVVLGPAAANPLADEVGHGTGESANIFAVAPDVELLPVKLNFVNTVGAFNAAVGLNPDIITCSWGSSKQFGPLSAADQALAAAIAAAVAAGITVIFSAGNGQWGFPGQHPDVISAGGVFMNPDETLQASNYASGFMSNIYLNRRVPDLSGLVGMQPRAMYLMLPLEEGDQIDVGNSGGTHPNGDETANNDGWAAFSGTSAAAPQLAGAAALIKQACPRFTPAEIRNVLIRTARDVTTGTSNPFTGGNAATVGPDTATGAGLVDAHRAVLIAKLRCLGHITPIGPVLPTPITPVEPITPIEPIRPIEPIIPIQPIRPIEPIIPVQPIIGPQPPFPQPPAESTEMAQEARPQGTQPSSPQLSPEDIQTLEDMVINSEIDLEDI